MTFGFTTTVSQNGTQLFDLPHGTGYELLTIAGPTTLTTILIAEQLIGSEVLTAIDTKDPHCTQGLGQTIPNQNLTYSQVCTILIDQQTVTEVITLNPLPPEVFVISYSYNLTTLTFLGPTTVSTTLTTNFLIFLVQELQRNSR